MVGTASSGNRMASKGINDRIKKAAIRAIKQAEAGLDPGIRPIGELMMDYMQRDFPGWLRDMIKLDPSILTIVSEINIVGTLQDARGRVIDGLASRDPAIIDAVADHLRLDAPVDNQAIEATYAQSDLELSTNPQPASDA